MYPVTSSRTTDRVLAALALLVAAAFATWVVSIATIDASDPSTFNFLFFAVLWVSAPYLALAVGALLLSTNWISRAVLAATTVAAALFGFLAFRLIGEDAQGAFLVLFVPLYQIGGAFIAIGIVVLVEFLMRVQRVPPDE